MAKHRKSRHIFIILTLVLVLVDGIFVYMNNRFANEEFLRSVYDDGSKLRSNYNTIVQQTYKTLLTLATFIGTDQDVTALFLTGKKAVEAEGGGPGGEQAAMVRQALYQRVGPNWGHVQNDFGTRQLHFHLGPGDTSFLRVHKPDKFGDDLSAVRFTIIDTNREKVPRTGFELGRVYAGLRGVVPVFANDPEQNGARVYVGALEVGTSFETITHILDQQHNVGVGVLLREQVVNDVMWPDAIARRMEQPKTACGCFVEAASRPEMTDILSLALEAGETMGEFSSTVVTLDDKSYAVSHFPLRDYQGDIDPTKPAVGVVMMWWDVTDDAVQVQEALQFNLYFALIGFFVIEVLLYGAISATVKGLNSEITRQTAEIRSTNHRLEVMAQTDKLTDLFNRQKLDEELEREVQRAQRYGSVVSVILLDLDHFKAVNDTYGHQMGDEVLQGVAAILKEQLREIDVPGRWGGEEFLILCPECSAHQAAVVAEKVRATLERKRFHKVGTVTASFGVSSIRSGDTVIQLVGRADKALYQAKAHGRNRVQVFGDA